MLAMAVFAWMDKGSGNPEQRVRYGWDMMNLRFIRTEMGPVCWSMFSVASKVVVLPLAIETREEGKRRGRSTKRLKPPTQPESLQLVWERFSLKPLLVTLRASRAFLTRLVLPLLPAALVDCKGRCDARAQFRKRGIHSLLAQTNAYDRSHEYKM